MFKNLPLKNPKPDAGHFIDFLMGRTREGRVPLVEYIVDDVLLRPIVKDLLGRTWVPEGKDRESQAAFLDNFIAFWHYLGYDFVRYERSLPFPMLQTVSADPVAGSDKARAWADQHVGTIRTWEDFERYPWPVVEEYDFYGYEYLNKHLPEGAKHGPPIRSCADFPANGDKRVPDLETALRLCGLRDGMTISNHHHLRNGDRVALEVLQTAARMGAKDLMWFPSASFP